MSGIWNRWLIVAVVLALGWNLGIAQNYYIQPKSNSPYSRFGLGDPADPYFAAAAGMAGIGASFNDPSHFNAINPASLGWLQVTAFEVGMYTRYSGLRSGDESSSNWSGNLNYFSLAIPLKNPINQALERLEAALPTRPDEVVVFAAASEAFSQRNINCSIARRTNSDGVRL